ncbi:trypsin-like peptidase domain-containing protein [Streptomyces sp. NPDC051907]|uniref:S1C family serine protease n=1 Tax=Streptomyces sp. NPDC051907 TaxID=3155284 RepID=UPI00342ED35F
MDDGKPTGPKAKWWSRPSVGRATHSAPEPEAPLSATAQPTAQPTPEQAFDTAVESAVEETAVVSAGETTGSTEAGPTMTMGPAEATGGTDTTGQAAATGSTEATTELPPFPAPAPAADPAPQAAASVPPEHAQPAPAAGRPKPLHDPDPYGTPPYGGPGPWAPAPPVQRPVPTPAQGTPIPPQHTQAPPQHAQAMAPPAPQPHMPPVPAPAPVPHQHHAQQPHAPHPHAPQPPQPEDRPQPLNSLTLQYDPWSTAGQPLTHPGEPPKKKRRSGSLVMGAVLLALVAGGIGGGIGAYIERNGGITQIELPQAGRDDGDRAPDSVAGIAASALPSVVTLHVSGGGEQGTGTGFVLDEQGHILTNNHVVDPAGAAGDITVTFSGGETAGAKLVGKDSGYDLAVVKVSGVSGLKPLPLGNSDNVRVGDPVVAIGAPFDLQNTVTSGIISAKERPITAGGEKGDGSDVSYVDALQTDAPINPGNSGGPLVDAKAHVIGINSAIRAADSGAGADGGQAGSIGLGFAIPINQGKRVAEELINTGKATHPVIGVSLDMKYTGDGARVGDKGKDGSPSVTPDGPSAKAGIEPGDVITKIDGQRVHSGEELIVKIRAHRPGDQLELSLLRDGKELAKTLTLGSADSS